MKNILLLCIILIGTLHLQAQEQKFAELDSLIANLYDVISGEAEEARDWELFRSLFRPEARLIPVGLKDGLFETTYMSPEDYINKAGPFLEKNGFYEKEIHRVTENFGNITHIFSTYETFKSKADTEPWARGINSIQLLFDNNRWWIVNIYWQAESPDVQLTDNYLPKK